VCPQIFCLSLCIFALALVGVFYPYNRGALFTALIVLYALTACIAGYISTSYYMQVRVDADPFVSGGKQARVHTCPHCCL
jgi:hypothetical protein